MASCSSLRRHGQVKGWTSANRLLDVRDTTRWGGAVKSLKVYSPHDPRPEKRRGYLDEGDFYREAREVAQYVASCC